MFDGPENRYLAELPDAESRVVRALLDAPDESADKLRQMVEQHIQTLQAAQSALEFLDLGLAGRIATACDRLLGALGTSPPGAHLRIVRSAVLYFIQDDDVESDTGSILGLDDDAAVVAAAARAIGRADLAPSLT